MGKQAFITKLPRTGLNKATKKNSECTSIIVLSMVLYGVEIWTIRENGIKVLKAFKM